MKIGMLGKESIRNSKTAIRFNDAAKELGISFEFYSASELTIKVEDEEVKVLDHNMEPIVVDAIINWMPSSKQWELYEAFISQNIPVVNSFPTIRNCICKILTNIVLQKNNIPQPRTMLIKKLSFISNISLEPPLICKRINGSRGMGMYKIEDDQMFCYLGNKIGEKNIYLQEYVKNNGWDIRVVVVGDKVLGGMKKTAKQGEFRTHVAHGGYAEPYELNDKIKSICIKTAKALNLCFGGIDIIENVDGKYQVLEVNSRPGMTLFHKTTGIDIAYEVLKYLKEGYICQ